MLAGNPCAASLPGAHVPEEASASMPTLRRAFRAAVLSCAVVLAVPAAHAAPTLLFQLYHGGFDHWLLSADAGELEAVDNGQLYPWSRTGEAIVVETTPGPGLVPVCRFYTSAFAAKATHFFTASQEECAHVASLPWWTAEGIAFYAAPADAQGSCPTGLAPIHRLYNDGMGDAPNHVYTRNAAARDAFAAAGWIAEGTAFCVPVSLDEASDRVALLAGKTLTFRAFGDEPPLTVVFGTPGGQFDAFLASYGLGGLSQAVPASGASSQSGQGIAVWDPYSGLYALVFATGAEPPDVAAQIRLFDYDGLAPTLLCSATLQSQEGLPPSLRRPPFWSQADCG